MINVNRRALLIGAALSPLAAPSTASGQANWPNQVIRIIVPFAPGAFTDVSARLVAQELSEQLGQSVIVENRGGAGGTAGTVMVVRAAPDGYTLLLTDTSLSISPGLYPSLPYDPIKDLAQISRIAESPSILLVRPGLGPTTLAELVALAKQKPDQITFGSGGPGSSAHLAMELLLNVSGVKALHVPFRGVAAAIAEVIAGRVDMAIASLAAGVGACEGAARCSASACPATSAASCCRKCRPSPRRVSRATTCPTGGASPRRPRRPRPIIDRLHREIVKACAQPRLREAFLKSAALAVTSTPEEMTASSRARSASGARSSRAPTSPSSNR